MSVRYEQDQPDHFTYGAPPAAESDMGSSLPIELGDDTPPAKAAPLAVTAEGGESLANRFRRDFGPRAVPTHDVAVPGREGWSLRFRLDWNEAKTVAWRKQAKDVKSPDKISREKLAWAMIADQCTAILLDGEPIVLDGEQWTFRSPALQAMFEVHTPQQAVQRCIPIFSHLVVVVEELSAAAGGDALDPQ